MVPHNQPMSLAQLYKGKFTDLESGNAMKQIFDLRSVIFSVTNDSGSILNPRVVAANPDYRPGKKLYFGDTILS